MAARHSSALVLEDTELGRWALKRALEAEGFVVEAVSTWGQAQAQMLRKTFSLALVAVSSSPGDAGDMVIELRRAHPSTRLVLLADRDSIDDLRRTCGPETEILAKPFDLEAVVRVALSTAETAG